jgi:hypothetical protein
VFETQTYRERDRWIDGQRNRETVGQRKRELMDLERERQWTKKKRNRQRERYI